MSAKAVYEERDDSLEMATAIATGLDAKQDRGGCIQTGRKIHDIDADEDITLENVHDADMFGVHDLDGDEAAKVLSDVNMTLAQALAKLKSAKPKAVTAATITKTDVTRPKAKGLVIQEQEQASIPILLQRHRPHVEEQEELTIEEKSKLFQQLLEKRRKHFAAKRAEERRNKPPTKAQQRSIMCTYLKNMAGWKPKYLKTKSFANVQELFNKAMKRVNIFVDMDTKLVGGSEVREEGSETREESSSKRAGDELEQEPSKKQKMDDDKETEELKLYGNSQMYLTFGKMLKNFDREDLEVLWSIVKARFKKTEPNILYYLLVEKMYPLTKHILHQMFNDVKLQVDYECEMAFELLKLVKKQLKEGYVPQ
ncbi:hypothetical protein Tco_0837904 [Tanacetum coccineum]